MPFEAEPGRTPSGLLKLYFGYDSFREGQEQLIEGILHGRDVLGIMPTGAGKSLCYQIPALLLKGITLVISPLISLMKDQVSNLNQAGILAAYLNSSLTPGQYKKVLELAMGGRYPIIYVAPERLESEAFLRFALDKQVTISMVAVDEAHCVSQWGQDFRPSYLKIAEFIGKLPKRPVVAAFTATATAAVGDDIVDLLTLREPVSVTTGFDRPNLFFGVETPGNRYQALLRCLSRHGNESGIVYCLTRKHVEEVCSRLVRDGFLAVCYHAGLSDQERKRNQENFIFDRARIMVATNAFGMGIDKSDVRFVVHMGMPKNLESYYQEAGRAGRDGEPAECLLLFSGQDVAMNQFFIDHSQENQELDAWTRAMAQKRDQERLKKMTIYCYTKDCLRGYMLRYFGESGGNSCGRCSNCRTEFETVDATEAARAILGCVESCGQRYGATVILDAVRGADTEALRRYGMEEDPYYASLKGKLVSWLRQVWNQLQVMGYLEVTGGKYAVARLGEQAEQILRNGQAVTVKMAKEQKKGEKRKGSMGAAASGGGLPQKEEGLFERLRLLRLRISREAGIPPYMVFSDKTLTHMCLARPRNREELLKIPGVGAVKCEKYGDRFLACLRAGAS